MVIQGILLLNISSHSNVRNKNHENPYTVSSNESNPSQYSYNTPTRYPPSPVNYPSSPTMRGMNPPYPPINPIPARQAPYGGRPIGPYPPIKPINPIPARQVPYGGRQTDPYSEGASYKEMSSSDYTSTPSSNPGPKPPSNYDYEKPFSPTSTHSSKPFFPEEKAKPGGIMKYCCCGTCGRTCAIICCILIFLIIGLVVAILLWARPPKVDFLGVVPSPQGLPAYSARPSGFDFNLGLKIQVDNPNVIGAKFERIKAIVSFHFKIKKKKIWFVPKLSDFLFLNINL